MSRIAFYLRYAWRNLRRSARWTIFAVFCIGAGVATVVALRTLGLAIGDSLVDNVRQNLHGDIRISTIQTDNPFQAFNIGERDAESSFSNNALAAVETQVNALNGTYSAYKLAAGFQLTRVDAVTVGRPQFVSLYLIDPATFPPNDEIRAQDPAGVPLAQLFTGEGHEVVVSRNLADQQGLSVGDTVRLSNTEEQFIVRGIVATDLEAGITNLVASFFGFAYAPMIEANTLQTDPQPNMISIRLPDGTPNDVIARTASQFYPYTSGGSIDTAPDLMAQNAVIGDYIGRFILVMSLGALLIGGVGIINTMLVMVGRRSNEIAALKTFGLKGGQVFWLFMSEAFLLGVLGSIVGCVMGVLLSILVNQYGEAFLQQGLRWRLYPEALGYGLALGMVVTLVFGILPILTANKVRPAAILRPNETNIPRAGVFHSLVAIAAVVVVIGGISGAIIGNVPVGRGRFISGIPVGMVGVGVTLLILGVIVVLFWLIVWLVSKFPAFGIVDLRLALRNMTARRLRTATTLMAITAGMFALSAITFVGVGTREILQFQLSQSLGGNVLVFPIVSLVSSDVANTMLDASLRGIDGIQYRTRLQTFHGVLESVDGVTPEFELPFDIEGSDLPRNPQRIFSSVQLSARITDNPNYHDNVIEGRELTPEDNGQQVILIPADFSQRFTNVAPHVGSVLGIRLGNARLDFTVVGITASGGGFSFGQYVVPPGTIQPSSLTGGDIGFTILQTEPDKLNQVLLDLSAIPLILTLDITFIDSFLSRLIQQFSALPTVVGLLSLLAAAVTMANTVSLATLERRRQIGILKAVGLKGRRVLTIMLIENTVIGLLGGLLGIGVSALGVAIMTSAGIGQTIPVPRDAAPLAIALVAASVAIAWISTFLSSGVATRERVANVLRYE